MIGGNCVIFALTRLAQTKKIVEAERVRRGWDPTSGLGLSGAGAVSGLRELVSVGDVGGGKDSKNAAVEALAPFLPAAELAREIHPFFLRKSSDRSSFGGGTTINFNVPADEKGGDHCSNEIGLFSRLNTDFTSVHGQGPRISGDCLEGYAVYGCLKNSVVRVGKDLGLLNAMGQPVAVAKGDATNNHLFPPDSESPESLLLKLYLDAEILDLKNLARRYVEDELALPDTVSAPAFVAALKDPFDWGWAWFRLQFLRGFAEDEEIKAIYVCPVLECRTALCFLLIEFVTLRSPQWISGRRVADICPGRGQGRTRTVDEE